MMNLNSYLVILAYTTSDTVNKAKTLLKSSFSMLNEKFPDMLYMGIGNTCNSLYDIRNSYKKSMKSVDLCTDETRINELFEIDLDNPYTRVEILNCISIYRFLGQIK